MSEIRYPLCFIPVNADEAVAAGIVPAERKDMCQETIDLDLTKLGSGMTSSQVMSLDFIASSIAEGWKRPCYFAMTVPESYDLGLVPYMQNTGMAYQITPIKTDMSYRGDIPCNTDKMYENVMTKFQWGGLDKAKPGSLYLDETIRRMVTTTRTTLVSLAETLIEEGRTAQTGLEAGNANFLGKDAKSYAADRFTKARKVLDLMMEKLPAKASPYAIQMGQHIAMAYAALGDYGNDEQAKQKAIKLLEEEILRYSDYCRYYQSLSPSNYARITNADRFINERYLPSLFADYSNRVDQNKVEELAKKVQARGVNLDRIFGAQQ